MLTNYLFSYSLVEKSYLGIFSVLTIGLFIITIINVFITLVFRLRLEIFSFKFSIYFLIVFFTLLRLLTNINFKLSSYDILKKLD